MGRKFFSTEHPDCPVEFVPCNLCGANDGIPISRDGPLRLLRCKQCELVYVSPRLARSHILSLYDQKYFRANRHLVQDNQNNIGGYRDYIADKESYLQTFRRRMRWIEANSNRAGYLLDVGCAAGFFMLIARENDWHVQGVEPAAFVANYARDQLGLDVFNGLLREAQYPSGTFNVVTLWDVLEHMPDPRQELLEVNRILSPGGVVVLETQNIDSWVPKVLGERWVHFGHHLHLFHFSPRTIHRLLRETGFEVQMITRKAAGKVCTLRFLADKLHTINPAFFKLADALLAAFPQLERRSLYINLGDEMIVCARKR